MVKTQRSFPGEEILQIGGKLPILDLPENKSRGTRLGVAPFTYTHLVVRNPKTGEVAAITHIGHMTSEVEDPYNTDQIFVDVIEQLDMRGLGDKFEAKQVELTEEQVDSLQDVLCSLEDITGGRDSLSYVYMEDEN